MKNGAFGPKQLLIILIILLLITISGLVAGIIFSQNLLANQASELSKKLDEQAVKQLNPVSKKTIIDRLNAEKPIIDKIQSSYTKSDLADNTLGSLIATYAKKADINITSQTLSKSPTIIPNTKSVDIGVKSNTKYSNFIKFLTYVEKSLPKMQVTNISVKRATSGSPSEIDVTNLTIAIYYR